MNRAAHAGLFLWAIACAGAEPQESVLRGRVVDELKQPVADLPVTVGYLMVGPRKEAGPPVAGPRIDPRIYRAVTDAAGKYEIVLQDDSLWYGERYVTQTPDPAAWLVTPGVQRPDAIASGRMTDLVIKRLDQRVAGEVVDDQGRPVPGAAVGAPEWYGAWVAADAQGRFTLEHVPAGPSTVVALAGADWRATVVAEGGATGLTLALAPRPAPDPEADRALAHRLLNQAFDLARLERGSDGASNTWLEVSVALLQCDPDLAWQRVATLPDHWMRDRARMDMLCDAVELAPDWAIGQLEHWTDIADPDLRIITALTLAWMLQPTHPDQAAELFDCALTEPPASKTPFNIAHYELVLTAALWRFGRQAEADARLGRVAEAFGAVTVGPRPRFYRLLGWYWADQPEALATVLAVAPTATARVTALVTALQRQAWTAPAEAARRLPEVLPDLPQWMRYGKYAEDQEGRELARSVERAATEIGTALLLADPAAAQPYLALLTAAYRIECLGRVAARVDDPARERVLLDQAWAELRAAQRAGDQKIRRDGSVHRLYALADADGANVGPALEARLRRLEWRLGHVAEPLPPGWSEQEVPVKPLAYSAAVDPNGAWLNLQPRLAAAVRDATGATMRANLPLYAAALCPISTDAAAALATMGARQELGEHGGGVTTQIQSLCAVGLYLMTASEQRSVLPYDFGEYQDALDPSDRRVAW